MVAAIREAPSLMVVGPPEAVQRLGAAPGRPSWIVAAGWGDEASETKDVWRALMRWPSARVAAVGPATDQGRFERWRGNGAQVYLGWPAARARLIQAVTVAAELDVTVYDRRFLECERARRAQRLNLVRGIGLTPREREVMCLLREGRSNPDMASGLGISLHTVEFHVSNLLSKLGASSRLEAVALAGDLIG